MIIFILVSTDASSGSSLLNNRIAPTSTLRSSWLMWPTPPSATTQGSTGYAILCTSTVSSVVSPPQARSSVACAARATPTTRTGPPGEPPGSATRPSPSAAIAEQLVWGFGCCHCRTCPKQNKNFGRVWLHVGECVRF